MALISFDGVSRLYKEGDEYVHALEKASFGIDEGSFIAVMGPSGSGKSTLLSILGVLNTPTEGKVLIDGLDVFSLGTEKQADFRFEYLGFVFQSFQLIPYLTAKENVMLPFSITKKSKRDQEDAADAVLKTVGLEGKEDRLPSKLSGGEAQRVAIARAIVNEPPILLADEPTGNLDTHHGQEIMELLKSLNRGGQTIVMVTHDDGMAAHADRTIRLLDGRIDDAA